MTKQEKFALAESNNKQHALILNKKVNNKLSASQTYEITEDMINDLYYSLSSSDFYTLSTPSHTNHTYYRQTPIQILLSGKTYMPPAPSDIPHLMEHFIGQINTSKPMFHPIEFSVYVHKRIIDMQPFPDHNDVVALELMNYILKKEGYPSIQIPESKKSDYETALIASQTPGFPEMEQLVLLITDFILEAQKIE